MSYSESSPSCNGRKKAKKSVRSRVTRRPPSASEIAKNNNYFETWSTYQNMEQVSYVDIPEDLKADVTTVFTVSGRIPLAWVDKKSDVFDTLKNDSPHLLDFLCKAHKQCPSLFIEGDDKVDDLVGLRESLSTVFHTWKRLKWMLKSQEKWSEGDFVGNVYSRLRGPAIQQSTYRVQCRFCLPHPPLFEKLGCDPEAARILTTKTVIPDSVVFLPASCIRDLSGSFSSAFKELKRNDKVMKKGSSSKCSSFRFQSTPCASIPDTPGFEFASSVWEDKKPVHSMLEDAYRQNRMSTASAARHLNSMHVNAPVFGLVWAHGTVRAHVDWCKTPEEREHPIVFSAQFVRPESCDDDDRCEWQLSRPGDILQVHFLIQNIDLWTVGRFRERVLVGIRDLEDGVLHKEKVFAPWRRVGDLLPTKRRTSKENITCSTRSSPASTPLKRHAAKARARR